MSASLAQRAGPAARWSAPSSRPRISRCEPQCRGRVRAWTSAPRSGAKTSRIPVYATVSEALDGVDVLIDYTSHETVKANTLAAIERGVAVVIGASGPTADDYAEIDAAARARGVGVISSGNFSITAAMAQAAAVLVARHLPQAEIIDYASDTKADVPSGTSRELAERLAQ